MRKTPSTFCGKFGIAFLNYLNRKLLAVKFSHLYCNSWTCPRCSAIKAKKVKNLIRQVIIENKLKYALVLTLDPKLIPPEYLPEGDNLSHKYITKLFNTLLTNLKREHSKSEKIKYVWVIEFQPKSTGNAHLHIVLNTRLSIDRIRKIWTRIGGGNWMWAEKVRTIDGIAAYMGKYITKGVNEHDSDKSNLHFFEKRYSISRSCTRFKNTIKPLINKKLTFKQFTNHVSKFNLTWVYNRLVLENYDDNEVISAPDPSP
jgi:hypothetical protein